MWCKRLLYSAEEVVQYIQAFYAGTCVMQFQIVGVAVTDGYFQDNEVCVEKTSCYVSVNAKEHVVNSTEICNGTVMLDSKMSESFYGNDHERKEGNVQSMQGRRRLTKSREQRENENIEQGGSLMEYNESRREMINMSRTRERQDEHEVERNERLRKCKTQQRDVRLRK